MRTSAAVAVVLVVVLAGCNVGPLADGGTGSPTPTYPATGPPDPPSDTLGWEAGFWHNESITVDRSDGLNDSELNAVVARAMARVEVIRGLEFEERVPVEVISRAEFRNRSSNRTINASDRLHQNVKWEAMFMVNESTDAIAVQQSNVGSSVGGYYSPREERIVIVSENTSSPKMNEITLAQELFHALQDQRFNVSGYNQTTEELHNARDGIIEGDGNYVDYLYEQRCEAEWDCLMPESDGGGGGGDLHLGLYLVTFAPYSEGPEFVRDRKRAGGWAAVNEVYADPPASTEQIIHHGKYGTDEPTDVRVRDRSSDGWRVLELEGGVNYAQYGEAGLYSMFWYATFEESQARGEPTTVVIPYANFLEYRDDSRQQLEEIGPYSYDHPVTAGWDGDKLVPYVNDSSAATNETGYVWKSAWDSEADATAFREGYVDLLLHHGAEPVDGRPGTYRIPDDGEFGDAFYVHQEGTTVVVVNAPTVAALGDVRAGAGTAE